MNPIPIEQCKREATIDSINRTSNASINNLSTNVLTTTTSSSSSSATTNVTNIRHEFQTPNSIRKPRNGAFHSFPIVNTPTPPSRFRKIINPFEVGITERLHLPLIDSPSLFHRPATPQLCSTQLEFEWTIDEVSSLNPANVEAHETQFVSTIDPELEAKAQAAISSYFKDGHLVPSPDDCPLRDQKIILGKTTRDNQQLARIVRDNSCQTELTLPPILPAEVEMVLRPYFTFLQDQQKTPIQEDCDSPFNTTMQYMSTTATDHDARDASLRRKLFQTHCHNTSDHSSTEFDRDVHLDSPAPQTPEMQLSDMRSRRFITPYKNVADENEAPLNISLGSIGRESFGCCISPISKDVATTPKSRPTTAKSQPTSQRKDDDMSLFRSTPDHHSSGHCTTFDMSTDNAVNCSQMSIKRKSFHLNDERSSESNETDNFSLDDEMITSYGSQQHPQTPTTNKSKRRCNSVNRKNLSRSFNQIEENAHSALSLDRTDSGFNDMSEFATQHLKLDESIQDLTMIKCATYSDKNCDISMTSAEAN